MKALEGDGGFESVGSCIHLIGNVGSSKCKILVLRSILCGLWTSNLALKFITSSRMVMQIAAISFDRSGDRIICEFPTILMAAE
jgi:hypothetical protein